MLLCLCWLCACVYMCMCSPKYKKQYQMTFTSKEMEHASSKLLSSQGSESIPTSFAPRRSFAHYFGLFYFKNSTKKEGDLPQKGNAPDRTISHSAVYRNGVLSPLLLHISGFRLWCFLFLRRVDNSDCFWYWPPSDNIYK